MVVHVKYQSKFELFIIFKLVSFANFQELCNTNRNLNRKCLHNFLNVLMHILGIGGEEIMSFKTESDKRRTSNLLKISDHHQTSTATTNICDEN